MCELKSILCMTIERKSGCWLIHQINYVDEITTMFNVNNVKAQLIPLQSNFGLNLELSEEVEVLRQPVDVTKYRQAIGKLMYLMVCTRPDMSFSVSLF